MLKIRMVDGLIEMPKYPIIPAVIIWGMIFGINEIKIILKDENIPAIKRVMRIIASARLQKRFSTR